MESKVYVVGIGPGTREYLLPIATRVVQESEVIIGGERALELFQDLNKETYLIKAQLLPLVDYIKENYRNKKIAVLVSGDPGFYSMMTFLKKHFQPEELEVIPGISSMQLAFARLTETWQDATLSSVHGRGMEVLDGMIASGQGKWGFLTDLKHSPQEVARYLKNKAYEPKAIYLLQNLGYPEEEILRTSIEVLLLDSKKYTNCVMVIDNG